MAYELKNVQVTSIRVLPGVLVAGDGSVRPGDLVSLNPQPLPPRYRRF